MERLSAEGFFFHRSCFQCFQCRNALRLAAYTFDPHSGESPLSAPSLSLISQTGSVSCETGSVS